MGGPHSCSIKKAQSVHSRCLCLEHRTRLCPIQLTRRLSERRPQFLHAGGNLVLIPHSPGSEKKNSTITIHSAQQTGEFETHPAARRRQDRLERSLRASAVV